jgi:hypothetical protein
MQGAGLQFVVREKAKKTKNYTKGDMRLEIHHRVKVPGLLEVSALHISLSCRINCMFRKLRTLSEFFSPQSYLDI